MVVLLSDTFAMGLEALHDLQLPFALGRSNIRQPLQEEAIRFHERALSRALPCTNDGDHAFRLESRQGEE